MGTVRKNLDYLDVRILDGLGKYGPRNIAKVAEKLDIPRGTLLSRMKRMSNLFYLRMSANVYHTNLGLRKAVVFAEATPGHEETLLNCMKINKFYIYLSRSYGTSEGCIGIYVIPKGDWSKFEQFVQEIKKLGVARRVELSWSTCFHTVNRTTNWFDSTSDLWTFPWDKWIQEVQTEGTDLPYTLIDPDDFLIKGDETDLFILKELEKNAAIDLIDIAKEIGTTLQNVHHHYKAHILKRGLLETFQIGILPFDRSTSDMFFFMFKFQSQEKLARFANSLLDKPFVGIVGKILGECALISQIFLPRLEFRNFVESLSKLARSGYLRSYHYVIQDLRPGKWSRATIPYQLFRNGAWIYDHNEHIKDLHETVEQAQLHPQMESQVFQRQAV